MFIETFQADSLQYTCVMFIDLQVWTRKIIRKSLNVICICAEKKYQ